MRLLISFLCFIVFTSCHNKGDLKRIAELEKENAEMKEKLSPESFNRLYEFAKKDILDSIILGKTIEDKTITSCGFDMFYAYTNSTSRSIKLNEKYNSDISFVIKSREDYFDSVYYSLPNKYSSKFNSINDIDKMMKAKKNFTFIPKDTGWYYSYIVLPIKNKRTGVVKFYPITDSFYVYK